MSLVASPITILLEDLKSGHDKYEIHDTFKKAMGFINAGSTKVILDSSLNFIGYSNIRNVTLEGALA